MKLYQIKNVLIASLVIVVFSHFIPNWLNLSPQYFFKKSEIYQTNIPQITSVKIDTIAPKKQMNSLDVLKDLLKPAKIRRIHNDRNKWTLYKGIPFLLQIHQTISTLDSIGCQVIRIKEHFTGNFVNIDWKCPNEKEQGLQIVKGSAYYESSSKLAIVFRVSKMPIELLNELNNYKAPLNLIFQNTEKQKDIVKDIERIRNKTSIVLGRLEPKGYYELDRNYAASRYGELIQVFDTEDEISSYITRRKKGVDDLQWISFDEGSLARKNPKLLEKVFNVLAKHNLQFFDIMHTDRDLINKFCIHKSVNCLFAPIVRGKSSTLERINSSMEQARKSGKNILVLEANLENLKIVNEYLDDIANQGTKLVSLDEI